MQAGTDGMVERCVARANGNPLFLEQLLRNAQEAREGAVPNSVQNIIQARLDRLDAADKECLQAAAIFGQRFSFDGVAHLLGREPEADRLLAHHLVRTHDDGHLFSHALIRDAVYASLLKSRRKTLHAKAALWFAQRDKRLWAEHLELAGDPAAAGAFRVAAEELARAYRQDSALAAVERGLALDPGARERFELLCLKGELCHDLGSMAQARSAYEEAMDAAQDDLDRCRAWLGLASVKRIVDDLDGALLDLASAQKVAETVGRTADLARIHFLRGNILFPRGDIEGCLREHGASLELARAVGSAEAEAAALGGLGDAEYMVGRMVTALEMFTRCVEVAQKGGFGRIEAANRPMAAISRMFVGEVEGALADALAAVEAARRIGHQRAEAIGHHAAFFSLRLLGRLDEASPHVDQALELARRLGSLRFEAEALGFCCVLKAEAGLLGEARDAIAKAFDVLRETGLAYMGPFLAGLSARVAEDRPSARAALERGDALVADNKIGHNHILFRGDAIETCLRWGDWMEARRHADALEAFAERRPSPLASFVIARGRALAQAGERGLDDGLCRTVAALIEEAGRCGFRDALPALEACAGYARPQDSSKVALAL
jgi:tetratricopeptide (TPR) repeat protein